MKGLLFTYVLTYGGALASLFSPFIGLLIYICFAIVKPESMWFWSVPQGNYSRIVAIGLLAGWAIHGFGSWDFGRARGLVVALVGFWLCCFAGIALGSDTDRSWKFFEAISKIILPFLVGITTIRSMQQVKVLAWVLVLSEGYVALEFNVGYYAGYNRLWEEGFGNMDNNCNAIALVSCIGLAFFLGLHTSEWYGKLIACVAAGMMANAIFFSFSRGGMLALFVTVLVAFLLIPKTLKHYLALCFAIALLWRLAGPQVTDRFETIFLQTGNRDYSAQSRIELWAACLRSIWEHPLGVGPDHWPLVVHEYGFPKGKEAHTLWLQVGAELGLSGLLCLALFFGLCVVRLWPFLSQQYEADSPWFRYFARMVIASLVGFVISAQFVSVKILEHPYYIALIGAAVIKLSSGQPNNLQPTSGVLGYVRMRLPSANPAGLQSKTS